MVAAHEVMLPFVLATVIAYVLTPLVTRAEQRKVPRPLAVLIVYAVVVGAMAAFVAGVAPRIGQEFRNLRKELPALAAEARNHWVPAVTERLRQVGVTTPTPEEPEPEATTPSAF